MLCQQCGSELPDGAAACPSCGTQTPGPGQEQQLGFASVPAGPREPPKHHSAVLALCLFLALVVAAGAWYHYFRLRPVPIVSLIPEGCPQVLVADASWFWDASKDLRRQPDVVRAFIQAERELGVSFEHDVAPWVGQVGEAMLDAQGGPQQFVLLIEVRDQKGFRQSIERIRKAVESKTGGRWQSTSYSRVDITYLDVPQTYGPTQRVATCVIGRWCVVGVGQGAVEKVIDAKQGRRPSLERSAAWSVLLGELPKKPIVWFAVDVASLQRMMRQAVAGAGGPPFPGSMSLFAQSIGAFVMSEESSGLRLDYVFVPTSDRLRALYRDLKVKAKGVTGKALTRLPEGTVAAFIFSNPGQWWNQMKAMALEFAPTPLMRDEFSRGLQRGKLLESAIGRCTGECGAAVVWRERTGLGFVALGETESEAGARSAAAELQRFAQQQGETVARDGAVFKLPKQAVHEEGFTGVPTWKADGRWVAFSTKPDWLSGKAPTTKLELPPEAQGASFAAVGDLHFLPALLRQLEKQARSRPDRNGIAALRRMGLEKSDWAAWMTIEPQGNLVHAVIKLRSWDWRRAIKAPVQQPGSIGGNLP